jgi:hypothetical protein
MFWDLCREFVSFESKQAARMCGASVHCQHPSLALIRYALCDWSSISVVLEHLLCSDQMTDKSIWYPWSNHFNAGDDKKRVCW